MDVGRKDQSAELSAFHFRLYPTRKQEKKMLETLETCRLLWNDALWERKERWKEKGLSTTYNHQAAVLTESKGDPSLLAVHSQVLQDVLKRADRAFERFFSDKSEYPKFKKKFETKSFTYPQASNGSVRADVSGKRLSLSKIGRVRAVFHRQLPSGDFKLCTVKREVDGKWFASLIFESVVPLQDLKIPGTWKAPIGIDLGLKALIATSDGQKVNAPQFLRKSERKLKRLQRSLSKKEKGSKNREKARVKLARQHSHVANQRTDFNQKLSTEMVEKHDLMGFEDLQIENMVQNHALAKSIHDAAWGQLVKFTEYKGKRKRSPIVKVNPRFTTQTCWHCGKLNKIPLEVREFECWYCHHVLDRDVNAGRIVLVSAIAVAMAEEVGQDRPSMAKLKSETHSLAVPELKPDERGPTPTHRVRRALPMKRELHAQKGWKPTALAVGGCHPSCANVYPNKHLLHRRLLLCQRALQCIVDSPEVLRCGNPWPG